MIDTLWHLIAEYGYFAVAVGCFFEGEVSILLGVLAANNSILTEHGVWLAAMIGTLLADNVWFHIGHKMGRPALAKRPHWHARATRIEALLERYGPVVMIGFRFVWAMRSLTPFVLGSLGVSPWRFLFYDFIGTLIWSTAVTIVSHYLIHAIGRAINHIQNVEQALLALVIVSAGLSWLVCYLRRRSRQNHD
ncbi:DedA family protein [Salinisphaera sp.]|uniref:DedA family protein n=1 Tax=Salinisphaera sp. TaxID=1914330 RepID=UPI002D76676A|nr:DedA family protein [Salinisphaera sp.]HET7315353.1 DedA family protein [Salinisphaera sp.]